MDIRKASVRGGNMIVLHLKELDYVFAATIIVAVALITFCFAIRGKSQ